MWPSKPKAATWWMRSTPRRWKPGVPTTAPPASARCTTRPTTAHTCWTPTATTPRRSATGRSRSRSRSGPAVPIQYVKATGGDRMRDRIQAQLAQATAELRAHMASWEYAFAMAGGAHGALSRAACPDRRIRGLSRQSPATAGGVHSRGQSSAPSGALRMTGPSRRKREQRWEHSMAENRGVAYMGPGEVELHDIDFPTFELQDGPGVNPANVGRKLPHAAILRIVATNICGSDQHMVRGRTTAPEGLILGHEITGEVIETGPGVEFIKEGDLCSVPFNIACGRCRMCKTGNTGVCLNVNPDRPGSAYGYVDMGGWVGGEAEYVVVPYADWNLLKFPEKEQAMEKILELTVLSGIFPTGYHGCYTAGVTSGSTVYIAGAGPVGLAAAYSAHLLGAAVVIVGDLIPD